MNTGQLECFLELAANLSYARTAEIMRLSQPAVTRQIQSLENELGVRLFRRSTRKVRLTDEGKEFLPDARNIVTTMHKAVHRFEERASGGMISFTVCCSSFASMSVVADVLAHFQKLHPNVHPEIRNMPLSQSLTRIDDESVNAAVGVRLSRGRIKGCSYRELFKSPLACVFRKGHPAEKEEKMSTDVLRKFPFILYHSPDAPQDPESYWSRITDGRAAHEIYFCDSPEAAVMMASSGLGIAVMPKVLTRKSVAGIDTRVIEDGGEVSFGVYYKTGHLTNELRDFLRLLAELE